MTSMNASSASPSRCSADRGLVAVHLVAEHDVVVVARGVHGEHERARLGLGVDPDRVEAARELVALAGLRGELGEDHDHGVTLRRGGVNDAPRRNAPGRCEHAAAPAVGRERERTRDSPRTSSGRSCGASTA